MQATKDKKIDGFLHKNGPNNYFKKVISIKKRKVLTWRTYTYALDSNSNSYTYALLDNH